MKISELKKEAKMKLEGKWPLAIVINLINILITFALTCVAAAIHGVFGVILALIGGIISIPLSYGLTASMLKLSRSEVVGATDFISIGFKNFKKALFLSLSIFIRIIIPIIVIAFASILSIISNFAHTNGAGIISIITPLLSIGAIIWLFCKILSYALSTYILIDNENMNSKEAINKSSELMKGNRLKFIGLIFSFFGWLLLCGFLGGMASAFNEILGTIVTYASSLLLTPYITFTEINFYEKLAEFSVIKTEKTESSIE